VSCASTLVLLVSHSLPCCARVVGSCCRQSYIQLVDPAVLSIAAAHNKTAAQVLIQWEFSEGMPINVRSQNEAHMRENLARY